VIKQTALTSCALLISLLGGLGLAPAATASSCKGLAETDCSTRDSCTWVQPYSRSDGRSVRGYCRARSGSASAADKPAAPKQDG